MESSKEKYPLACDMDGNPIAIPDGAAAWRVRKGGGRRGRPRPVFDQETGRQLEMELGAAIEDLIEAGCRPGRYRLELVDGEGRLMTEAPAAIIQIPGASDEDEAVEEKKPAPVAAPVPDTDRQLIAELVRANCSVMLGMASAFGKVSPIHSEPQVIVEQAKPGSDGSAEVAAMFAPDKLMPMLAMLAGPIGQIFKGVGAAAASGGAVP